MATVCMAEADPSVAGLPVVGYVAVPSAATTPMAMAQAVSRARTLPDAWYGRPTPPELLLRGSLRHRCFCRRLTVEFATATADAPASAPRRA